MDFVQIRAFHHVAAEGGVVRAAQVLGVSQSTISQHIKALEDRHQVQLFAKVGRGLKLTEAGETLFVATQALMRAADTVTATLAHKTDLSDGKLKIATDSAPIAVELMKVFAQRHPGVNVSIRMGSMVQIMSDVKAASVDAGVTVDPPASDDLVIAPLYAARLCLVVNADHPMAKEGRPAQLSALSNETLILREATSRTRSLTERALSFAGVTPKRVLEIDGRDGIREAIAHGLGVTLLAENECPPDARLARIKLDGPGRLLEFDEYLVVRRDHRRLPVVAALLGIAEEISPAMRAARRGRGD